MLKNKAFTLIEIMVVVAIIGVLAAILVPQLAKAIQSSKVARTGSDLATLRNAMNTYLTDQGSYPPSVQDFGRSWGADVGLVDRSQVTGRHLSTWNGPYLQEWPQKTAWGGGNIGCGAQGAYFVHIPIGWIDRDGIAGNDYWIHMSPYCNSYPQGMAMEIDKAIDDGNPNGGNIRLTGGWPEYVYYYVGEGPRMW